ncbi:sulfatase [Pelagicoccus mobilis]|uniref:Sulfatase n=1 Tax=Pelagicoccus mobilis TaxID=415221 RepID=A0A934RZQ4_9BACT|nr:sulfatase [Pelagicoccus mobilis]MBK1876453.1 sulfatase [Pelagicoccus mobilis]
MRASVFLGVVISCQIVFGEENGGDSVAKPNIIYINADDLGWMDLSVQGSTYYESPNIDRLAREGMIFTNGYSPSSNCTPSRAACITGQYAPRHGIYTVDSSARGESKDRKLIPTPNTTDLDTSILTMPEVLKEAGYVTAHIGKWHLGPDPLEHGYDVNVAGAHWGFPPGNGYDSPYDFPNCVQEEEGEYLTDRLGEEAVRFIEGNKDRPFFLSFWTHSIHSPIQGKKELVEKYEQKTASEAHDYPTYAAMVQSLDENVGKIMDTLKKHGLDRSTLVVFTSDNGGVWRWSKQWPLRAGKGSFTEGGIRVPLFVRWPGVIKEGSSSETPVSGIDLFPTFLEAAGIGVPKRKVLDGVSLMPLLSRGESLAERALYWHFPIYLQGACPERNDEKFRTRPGSVIRYGDWKLHQSFEDGRLELYNLKDDIGEKHDLVGRNPEKADELLKRLNSWREKIGAPVPTQLNPDYRGD